MSNSDIERANRYFLKRTETVYVDRLYKIESFREYLNHRYQGTCYYYSAYALMGLNPNDFLVRGLIVLNRSPFYHHGWVEFEFEGNEYVFDSLVKTVLPKEIWYKRFYPRIDYKKTQKKILDEFLNKKYASKITKGFWQFKSVITDGEIDYYKIIKFDENNGHVPSALRLSRINVSEYNSQVLRFLAYFEPSG